MKKLLISMMIILICVLTVFTILKGIHIGSFSILGIQEIKSEDAKLDKKVTEATKLVSTDYPNKILEINKDIKDMKTEKETYQDMVAVSTESEIATAVQKQKYTIDKLWTRIGTLATDEGLDAKFVFKNGTLQATETENFNYYNIEFEVTGSYVGVSLYISDLEDDSELGFRIENFKMTPVDGGASVKATFETKDIAIQGILPQVEKEDTEEGAENAEDNETTNKSLIDSINGAVTDVTRKNTKNETTDTVG